LEWNQQRLLRIRNIDQSRRDLREPADGYIASDRRTELQLVRICSVRVLIRDIDVVDQADIQGALLGCQCNRVVSVQKNSVWNGEPRVAFLLSAEGYVPQSGAVQSNRNVVLLPGSHALQNNVHQNSPAGKVCHVK
jgi:hypothetical protein